MKISSLLRNKAVENGIWLYALQFFNTVIPMLTIPYITRVLGPEGYGEFTVAFNLIGYFQVVVEYGFAMSGARKASLAESDEELHSCFTSMILARLLLCFICAVVAFAYSIIARCSTVQTLCILLLFLIPIGTILQQTWLFQGKQKMKYITISSIISRIASLVAIFVFVKSVDDLAIYCVCYSITTVLMGVIGVIIAVTKLNMRFVGVKLSDVVGELKNGWYVFISSLNSLVFSAFGITVLGFMCTKYEVGIYSAIQKIPMIMLMGWNPISQVLYPISSRKTTLSYNEGRAFIKKFSRVIIPVTAVLLIVIGIFSGTVIKIVLGNEYYKYSYILLPLLVWILAGIFNNFNGVQTLLAGGYSKEYSRCLQIGVGCTLILDMVLIKLFGIIGASIAPAISEVILGILLKLEVAKLDRKMSETAEC